MRKKIDGEIMYRTHVNGAPEPTRASYDVDQEACLAPSVLFGDHRDQVLVEAVGELVAHERERERREIERRLIPLRREIDELRGRVDALLTVIAGKATDNVVGLPKLPMKGRVHVA